MVHLSSVVNYQIVNIDKAIFGIDNLRLALIEHTQAAFQETVGNLTEDVLKGQRAKIAKKVEAMIKGDAEKWGTKLNEILIKEFSFAKDAPPSNSTTKTSSEVKSMEPLHIIDPDFRQAVNVSIVENKWNGNKSSCFVLAMLQNQKMGIRHLSI